MENVPLPDRLTRHRVATPSWQPLYNRLVAKLQGVGVAGNAPRVGDTFPDFALPDEDGRYRTLASVLRDGPVVLSFNRGGWCPYCRHELEAWSAALPELTATGCAFAVVSGEVGGRAKALASLFVDPLTMFCDVDHGVALESGLAFYLGAQVLDHYRQNGIDLDQAYGSQAGLLVVPATYLIDSAGIVRFAYANPDFRERADPADVIEAVRGLSG